MPEIQMSERTRQARDRLLTSLKADPVLEKAFYETIDEMKKPENLSKDAAAIGKVISSVICLQESINLDRQRM